MVPSPDSQVLLLLCSHLGLPKDSNLAPLTLRGWNPLEKKIQSSSFKKPKELLGTNTGKLQKELDLTSVEADQIARLLDRIQLVERELERLAALGIKVVTRVDPQYPQRYLQRLSESAPVVLFFAGEQALLGQPGIAVVGSRRLDPIGQECASFVGAACGLSGTVLYSGGAKGVDTLSMEAALAARGSAVSVLADSLERAVRDAQKRRALESGDLCLVTPYSPNAGFSVGAAMGRNRLIYCLADYAIVVASDAGKGGTWAGATETIKAGWVPVFVLEHGSMPEGNRQLLDRGAFAFPHPFPEHYSKLSAWLSEQSGPPAPKATQLGLF